MGKGGKRKKEGKKGRKSENISKKGGNRVEKIRKTDGKRPHITGPHLFFYEEKLTGIWGLSKMKENLYIFYKIIFKKGSKN